MLTNPSLRMDCGVLNDRDRVSSELVRLVNGDRGGGSSGSSSVIAIDSYSEVTSRISVDRTNGDDGVDTSGMSSVWLFCGEEVRELDSITKDGVSSGSVSWSYDGPRFSQC